MKGREEKEGIKREKRRGMVSERGREGEIEIHAR